jgi:hypothetical protein
MCRMDRIKSLNVYPVLSCEPCDPVRLPYLTLSVFILFILHIL